MLQRRVCAKWAAELCAIGAGMALGAILAAASVRLDPGSSQGSASTSVASVESADAGYGPDLGSGRRLFSIRYSADTREHGSVVNVVLRETLPDGCEQISFVLGEMDIDALPDSKDPNLTKQPVMVNLVTSPEQRIALSAARKRGEVFCVPVCDASFDFKERVKYGWHSTQPSGRVEYTAIPSKYTAIWGFVFPGDRMDVVLITKCENGRTKTSLVLQRVFVLAVRQGKGQQGSECPLTLSVTPPEAEVLQKAEAQGEIAYMFRSRD